MSDPYQRRSKLYDLAARLGNRDRSSKPRSHLPSNPGSPVQLLGSSPGSASGSYSDHMHSSVTTDSLAPPSLPFAASGRADGSGLSSRRSSYASAGGRDKEASSTPGSPRLTNGNGNGKSLAPDRPKSLSVNFVPAKFTKLHAPGEWTHRRAKQGGGRDAFASNAQRMGMMGTVDDDEGVAFQVGKHGLKRRKPKLRWNRFKWVLFGANSVLIVYGMAGLVSAILVWLNVFYQADVIRVGNRDELILSTTAAALIVLTSLLGYSGILLNNRAFLAVYTLLLWVCLALMVAPGYMTYKQRTFNLEGKINSQWSRVLGAEGRLRIQDALRCCGYFSPYIEATQSPLCYPRSIFPGCKSRYLRLERSVLETWYAISFSLVPAHILIILAALLCSNHITYRFGKGLTPKQYRLDIGSMAVIMDEYASAIAAQYGGAVADEAKTRSSLHLDRDRAGPDSPAPGVSPFADPSSPGMPLQKGHSRLAAPNTTGYNSAPGSDAGQALFDLRRDSFDSSTTARQGGPGGARRNSRYQDAEMDPMDSNASEAGGSEHRGWAR